MTMYPIIFSLIVNLPDNYGMQHARNGGEKEIEPYKVDGYYENENGQQYVLEFNGKIWHGCLHCYNDSTVNPVNGMTMGDLYQRTMERKRYLEGRGYIYVGKWQCEFDKDVRENVDLVACSLYSVIPTDW
jgi:hypothetical protein